MIQVLLLTTVVDKLDIETKVALLQSFKKLIISASDVAKAYPDIFLDVSIKIGERFSNIRDLFSQIHKYVDRSRMSLRKADYPGIPGFAILF